MEIQILSDTVCPWCYVGKRNLEAAMAQRPDLSFEIHWLPFMLNPDMPLEGADRKQYWREKFGSDETISAMTARLENMGSDLGLPFDFDAIQRQPSTLKSHMLLHWQHGQATQSDLKENLLKGFFMEGRDIGNRQVLLDIVGETGLDREVASSVLDDDAVAATVKQMALQAREQGVSGVPTFIFNQKMALVGAQPQAQLLKAMDQME